MTVSSVTILDGGEQYPQTGRQCRMKKTQLYVNQMSN